MTRSASGYVGFSILPLKKIIDPKIQNFQNFQRTGIHVIQLVVVNQCAKLQFDSSFFTPNWLFLPLKSDQFMASFFKCDF